ncbi:MAG: winged helix-turn-helix transcriptional regulator [Alphaproteobacteria bacterium]|nr:winged helix-turn-helix transcriptional regulator [Alphaproteobacteria bacterium]
MDRKHQAPIVTLGVLNAVHESSNVTQRNLADELGIALGLANAYLRRCINKGHVKVRRAPARRYAYYLTPKGFAEKARLTAEYLSDSLSFFRDAKAQCSDSFERCALRGWTRVALAGPGELCEIALLSARDFPIKVENIIGFDDIYAEFAGRRVIGDLDMLSGIDAVVVTDVVSPQATYEQLINTFANERVLPLPLLRIVPPKRGS